ncbi:MAG: hypothetical protein WCI49_14700 [Ferruginibacter sp.]
MNNNNDHTENLIRYLDGELSQAEMEALQTELDNNGSLKQELENLVLAKDVIRNYGLTQKVNGMHEALMAEMAMQKKHTIPKLRRLPKMMMGIAAGMIIATALFSMYQYLTVSPANLYSDQYTAYQVANMRGAMAGSTMEKAYSQQHYDEVIAMYMQITNPAANEQFLTGQAYLSKEDYHNAILLFNAIIEKNKTTNPPVFQDDAEYYLALSYLKNNETKKALPLFTKINDDKDHLYHNKINNWFLAKVKLLNWKIK